MAQPQPTFDPWQRQTELATRVLTREDDEAAARAGQGDIGRVVAPQLRELFVTCAAPDALELQFSLRAHRFMFLHDVLGHEALSALRELAAEKGVPLQALHVRRQGFGDTLALLHHVDLRLDGPGTARIYALGPQPDGADATALGAVLMRHASLTLLMADESRMLSSGQAARASATEADRICPADGGGARLLVWLPLGSPNGASELRALLEPRLRTRLRAAPMAPRLSGAWPYLVSTWRLLDDTPTSAPTATAGATATSASSPAPASGDLPPLDFHPAPWPSTPAPAAPAAPAARPAVTPTPASTTPGAPADPLTAYATSLAQLSEHGATLILEGRTSKVRVQVVRGDLDPAVLARLARLLMVTSSSAAKMMGRDDTATAEWSSGDLHACLRPVPGEADLWCLTVIRPAAPGLLPSSPPCARCNGGREIGAGHCRRHRRLSGVLRGGLRLRRRRDARAAGR